MNSRFEPVIRLEDLVLTERVAGHHFEQLWIGAHPDDHGIDAPAIPVVLHDGPSPWNGLDADSAAQLGDEFAYVRHRLQLKRLLEGRGAPRILRLVFDDRISMTEPIGYVEEHAGDVSLARVLRRNRELEGQLPIGVCLAIARSIAIAHAALECAADGIRMGLQPDKIFIDDLGVVRTLAEPVPGWSQMATGTAVGVIRRNYDYFSPEEVAGTNANRLAPMYSLGLVLFELLAGRHAYQEQRQENAISMLKALYQAILPSLSAWRQDVPAPVAWLVERLTRRERNQRYATWQEAIAAIDGAIERTERATDTDIAAVCCALCPDEMALGRERREEIAVSNLAAIPLPIRSHRRLSEHRGHPPPQSTDVGAPLWTERTPVEIDAPFIGKDGHPMWRLVLDPDAAIEDWPPLTLEEFEGGPTRPRILLVDAVPVTTTAWARFCIETGRPPPPSWGAPVPSPELGETPVVDVSHDDAVAYATHYGKEIPTESLWRAAVRSLGTARLQVGAVWEWTATPRREGHIVCGGRFRDRPDVASDGQTTSWEDGPASDLGFRCVIRTTDTDPWPYVADGGNALMLSVQRRARSSRSVS